METGQVARGAPCITCLVSPKIGEVGAERDEQEKTETEQGEVRRPNLALAQVTAMAETFSGGTSMRHFQAGIRPLPAQDEGAVPRAAERESTGV